MVIGPGRALINGPLPSPHKVVEVSTVTERVCGSSRLRLRRQADRPLTALLQMWGQQVVCLDHVQQSRVAIDRRIECRVSALQILPREFNLTRPSRLDEVSSATASTTKRGRRPGSDPLAKASSPDSHPMRIAWLWDSRTRASSSCCVVCAKACCCRS